MFRNLTFPLCGNFVMVVASLVGTKDIAELNEMYLKKLFNSNLPKNSIGECFLTYHKCQISKEKR